MIDTKEKIKERIIAKYRFYGHLFMYILVNTGLIALNLWMVAHSDSKKHYWFVYPLLGWGIGLLAHFIGFYVRNSNFLEKKIEKELSKQKNITKNFEK